MTGYHMRGLCEFAKPMIDRFCATFAEPAYDHRVFDAEMAAVQNELGNIVNGEWHTLDEAIAGVLYAGTPLAAGERAKIANVQRLRDGGETGMQMLLGWRNTSYHPGLCSVSVFGDCPAYLLDTLKKRLSTIKGAVRELPCISNDSRVLSRQRDVLAADARYDSFHRIVFMFPLEFSTFEYEPRAAVECLSYVLSSGLGSRLYRELRTKRKLVYSVGSAPQLFVCAKMKSYFCIDTKFQVTDGDVAAQRRKVKDGCLCGFARARARRRHRRGDGPVENRQSHGKAVRPRRSGQRLAGRTLTPTPSSTRATTRSGSCASCTCFGRTTSAAARPATCRPAWSASLSTWR